MRYGRRRRQPDQRRDQWRGGTRWTDSAFSTPSWRGWRPNSAPSRPAPPPRFSRFAGPRPSIDHSRGFRREDPRPSSRQVSPQGREADDVLRQPADAELRRLFKKMFVCIKMVHHLQNVAPKPGKEGPLMISRMVEELTNMIKPACPTPQTMQMIQGNAENWGYNTLTILMDHYKEGLDKALEELDDLLVPDWRMAFQVSVRWARRNLPRLTRDAIDHAEALIASRVVATDDQDAQPRAQSPERTFTTAQTTRGEPQQRVRPQEGPLPSHPTRGPNKGRLAVRSAVRMTTSTPAQDSEDEEWELPSFQVPRQQRRVQRKTRGVVLREEDVPLRQDESDLIAWAPLEERSGQDSPRGPFSGLVTIDEVIEGDSAVQDPSLVQSPILYSESSGQRIYSPIQHVVRVHRSLEDDDETGLPSVLTDFSRGKYQPRRHMITQRKLTDWNLVIEKKWVLMGDSNLSRLPVHSCEDLQIDAFPGGHFRHAQALIEKACPPREVMVEKIVLAFGINSRENKSRETTIKNLQGAVRSAKKKFPYAEVWIPLINFSTNLPMEEQLNLQTLNDHVKRNMGFISPLPRHLFQTETDDIHWTENTGKAMFQHWWRELNWPPL